MTTRNKNAPAGDRRGHVGGRGSDELLTPHTVQYTTGQAESQDLSRLLDQAIARGERCEALAQHYSQQAAKYWSVKAELERRAIPTTLPPGVTFAEWCAGVVEEVWSDD